MTTDYTLTSTDIAHLQSVVEFCKAFSVNVLKLTSTGCVGIDETPTLAVFIEQTSTSYSGPDLFLNRLKVLDSRLKGSGSVLLKHNDKGNPVSFEITDKKKTIDFRLGSTYQAMPSKFTGSFAHSLNIPREDFREIIAGGRQIGGEVICIEQKNGRRRATSSKEGERFQYTLDSKAAADVQYAFNYSLEHLITVEKLMPPTVDFVGNITPRGQMMVELATADITARIFVLDIKNR